MPSTDRSTLGPPVLFLKDWALFQTPSGDRDRSSRIADRSSVHEADSKAVSRSACCECDFRLEREFAASLPTWLTTRFAS